MPLGNPRNDQVYEWTLMLPRRTWAPELHHFDCSGGPYTRQDSDGVCLGVSFFLQSTALMSGNSGTDARFPSRVRQNVVVG
jgi:hypothetical protein